MRKLDSVEKILEAYNDEATSGNEHTLSEDSCHAEFCASFHYGEMSRTDFFENAQLSDETLEKLKAYSKTVDKKAFFDFIGAHSSLDTAGIYIRDGEVCSVSIGEVEWQPSDDLLEAYLSLSQEEQEQVRQKCDEYISDGGCKGWLYLNHDYERFILICDEDSLNDALDEMVLEKERGA